MQHHPWSFGASLLVIASQAAAQWTVIDLHPAGTTESVGLGGGPGQQVGYARVGPTVGHTRASLWTGSSGSWVNLHPAVAVYSNAIASDGIQQVGEAFFGAPSHASLWTGSAASWVDLNPASAISSSASDVDSGMQVGWVNAVGYSTAAAWTGSPGSWINLNPPPTAGYIHTSAAYGVRGGRIVGHVVNTDGVTSAALWPSASSGWVNLHPPGNWSSWAYAVDGGTQVGVVRVPDTSIHAALWHGTAASWVDLHPPGATNSRASDVLNGMQVGYTVTAGSFNAALWSGSASSWVNLHSFLSSDYLSSEATAIVSEGGSIAIIGSGYNNRTRHTHALAWVGGCPCSADFNRSGGTPDGNDIADFFAAWLIGDPSADADCSGGTPDATDITVFFTSWLAGTC